MGRKIPAKKHRGVKDPLQQQAVRLQKLKNVINAPPAFPDDQPIPKSLTRLLEYKQQFEEKLKKKTKRKKFSVMTEQVSDKGEQEIQPHKAIAKLKRLPGETSRAFNLRINSAIKGINKGHLHEQEMERTLNPDQFMSDEDAKEERMDYIERKKQSKKEKKSKSGKDSDAPNKETKLSRLKKWTLKKKEKLLKKTEENENNMFEPRYDHVRFGEIAHEPPSLHIKPRKAKQSEGAPRPGRKDLLLSKLLNPSSNDSTETTKSTNMSISQTSKSRLTFDKKAKRKDLPVGVRMRLEQSQQEAIDAYRALKKENNKKMIFHPNQSQRSF